MDDASMQETLLTPNAKATVGNLRGRIRQESNKIWRIVSPSVIAKVGSFGTLVITQSFVGHVSAVDLAAYALVQILSVRFVNGMLEFLYRYAYEVHLFVV